MEVERCHAVAGFGRIETFEASMVVLARTQAEAIERLAPEALEHMNADHREALALYATRLLGLPPADWRAVMLDADGIDLSDGKRSVRLAFCNARRDGGGASREPEGAGRTGAAQLIRSSLPKPARLPSLKGRYGGRVCQKGAAS
jgi:hypothetical protein